ncbi:MAG: ArsR/SmtB family transcription factor [Desulfuromonadales bacterium]
MKQTAKRFKALSDETRLRILALLATGELCVCDLMAVLELPQSTVSRHLATLRNAALVDDRRQGVWMVYRLTVSDRFLLEQLEKLALTSQGQEDRVALQDFLAKKNTGCA